jgi:hypothetical protein
MDVDVFWNDPMRHMSDSCLCFTVFTISQSKTDNFVVIIKVPILSSKYEANFTRYQIVLDVYILPSTSLPVRSFKQVSLTVAAVKFPMIQPTLAS